jgi:uncharacterized membrane protein YhdT
MPQLGISRLFRRSRTVADGCGSWFFSCLVSLLFLLLNIALVQAVYMASIPMAPDLLRRTDVAQAVAILVPILLLLLEWWVVEFIADLLALRHTVRHPTPSRSSRAPRP